MRQNAELSARYWEKIKRYTVDQKNFVNFFHRNTSVSFSSFIWNLFIAIPLRHFSQFLVNFYVAKSTLLEPFHQASIFLLIFWTQLLMIRSNFSFKADLWSITTLIGETKHLRKKLISRFACQMLKFWSLLCFAANWVFKDVFKKCRHIDRKCDHLTVETCIEVLSWNYA